MKKVLKSRIFLCIVTVIISSSLSVYATNLINAKDVVFEPSKENSDNGWNVKRVDEALNDLYDRKIDLSKLELLWQPVGAQTNTYSGTYNFSKNYKYVIVVYYTNANAKTTYTPSNMEGVKYFSISRYHEGAYVYFYENVTPDSSIYFSINNLDRAGIGVFGYN